MNDAPSTTKTLRANPEHGGIRIAVLLTIFFGLLGGYLLIRFLLGLVAQGSILLEFATIISCVVSIPIALGCAWLVEAYLKNTWPSGQEFILTDEGLRFEGGVTEDGSKDIRQIYFDKQLNLTNWYFRLKGYPKAGRERRVSDKWYCLANQIQQDGERIITYTYFPPEEAASWIDNQDLVEPFHQISLAQAYKESGARRWSSPNRPELSSEIIGGTDGRFWIAERRRWDEGLELTADDFTTLMKQIEDKAQTGFE
jgi:hypothetical protein